MYENSQIAMAKDCGSILGQRKPDVTMGENLDEQIKRLEERLQELIQTKERLADTGLLTARIDDLRRAMDY